MKRIKWENQAKYFGLNHTSSEGTFADFRFDIRYDCDLLDIKQKPDCGVVLSIYKEKIPHDDSFFTTIEHAQAYSEKWLEEEIEKIIAYSKKLQEPVVEVPTPSELKKKVMNIISDLVGAFLYYDRKECEELPVGEIDKLVKANEITIDEMVAEFRKNLENSLNK